VLEFLMRYYRRSRDREALSMVTLTLDKMAAGGIYDQLGGGFHRYSTDERWLVPHFEKMLYDNALLSNVYLHAYVITGNHFFRRIAEETLDYVLREMTDPGGGFYSSQDADSEGVEGKYYLWGKDEIAAALDKANADLIGDYYGITDNGHLDGRNILHLAGDVAENDIIRQAKQTLLKLRDNRVKPTTDAKILTGWNALVLASLSEAACVLDRKDYLDAAVRHAGFIMDALMVEGRLKHSFARGKSKTDAFLQDYAYLGEALLLLHQVTFKSRWLKHAVELSKNIAEQFWDGAKSQLFDVSKANQELFMRPSNIADSPIPSGSSAAALLFLKIGWLTGDNQLVEIATKSIHNLLTQILQSPMSTSNWLNALDFLLSEPFKVVILGERHDPRAQALLHEICVHWLPNKVLAAHDPRDESADSRFELLADKIMLDNNPIAYVCRGFTCHEPVADVHLLHSLVSDNLH
jgi:uncharacterized protein